MCRLIKEFRTTYGIHQCIEECIEVTSCRVGKQINALCLCLFAQLPHFIPSTRNRPALFFQKTGIVKQTARRIEHRHEVGLAITVGIGQRGICKTTCDFIRNLDILTRNLHRQYIGNILNEISLDELFSQSSLTTGCQMNNVWIITALHGRSDHVFQLLIGGQLHLDSRFCCKCLANFAPHSSPIASFQRCNLNGSLCGRGSALRIVRLLTAAAACNQRGNH